MAGLLYPAYQKFYSALKNLQRFDKENNFFDNVSSLDSFFSEYRSITLVLQKSLAHTPYIERYKVLAKEKFSDSWMNDQRVKTVHIHPVEFLKQIHSHNNFGDKCCFLLKVQHYVYIHYFS